MKKQLLVSFSGGETSGFMAQWLKKNKSEEYQMVFVFANTGEENEETLKFVKRCDEAFNLGVVWVEAVVPLEKGVGTTHKIVDFESASRNGEPFEEMIKKFGIPNRNFPHCNRETKLRPIHSFMKNELKWNKYFTAIGIRYDEIDRMSPERKKKRVIYPLIEDKIMTKEKINFWWSQQDFRLNITGYQGNCKTCWKKSFNNLYTIAKENPEHFDFFKRMEDNYSFITAQDQNEDYKKDGIKKKINFFRGDKSVADIFKESKTFTGKVRDTNKEINYQINFLDLTDESESCDIFSNCGDFD